LPILPICIVPCMLRSPHASTPRNEDRFLGASAKRGVNQLCASGACISSGAIFTAVADLGINAD